MNYEYITNQEGYRVEDLNKEHQTIIKWLNHLIEDFESTDVDDESFDYEGDTLVDRMRKEIQRDFKEKCITELKMTVLEYQIAFGDNEAEEDDDQ